MPDVLVDHLHAPLITHPDVPLQVHGRYIRHQSETPMAITWELAHPLPGDLYASFAAALG